LRIVVTASDAASMRTVGGQLEAAGVATERAVGPCEIEISTLTAPTRQGALAQLHAGSLAAPPRYPPSFDGAVALDAPLLLLAQQMAAWERIAIGREEYARRITTAAQLNLPLPERLSEEPIRGLFVGRPTPMFLAIQQMFGEAAASLSATHSSRIGFDHLHDQNFDALILNGADDPQASLSFCAALKRNAAMFNLPVMVLSTPKSEAIGASAIDRGVSVVLDGAAPPETAVAWLFETIRRERLRRSTDAGLRALRDLMSDPRTGIWRLEPFKAHLDRMVAEHHAHGRPMSLVALRLLPAPGSPAPTEAAWRSVWLEVAGLAGRLVREADCVAAVASDQLIIAMPQASLACASRAAERVASVVECTAFAGSASYAAPVVLEQSVIALRTGESGAALLARALSALAPEQLSA
jgi:two-component system cell cycle response regulator PopA